MASEKIVELTEANFKAEVLDSALPVLVDFWAPWCGPCRMLAPVVEEVAEAVGDKAKVGKVNIDDNPGLAAQYGVRAIPTVVVFRAGKAADQVVGMAQKSALLEKLGV